MTSTRVGVAQLALSIDDPDANRAAVEAAASEAAVAAVEVLVLPELAGSGYVFADTAELVRSAEAVDGPSVTLLTELSAAYGMVLIGGWCERGADGHTYNSAVLVDRGTLLATYRKTHLWDTEHRWFTAGDRPPPVVETRFGLIGVCLCYDLEIPELVRDLALRGAQLIAAPSNWPALEVPPGERPVEVSKAIAAASTNRVAVAVADRCGTERGVAWTGASLICGVDGYPAAGPATAPDPTLLWADLDLTAALDKRLGPYNDALADRRPELYRGC